MDSSFMTNQIKWAFSNLKKELRKRRSFEIVLFVKHLATKIAKNILPYLDEKKTWHLSIRSKDKTPKSEPLFG